MDENGRDLSIRCGRHGHIKYFQPSPHSYRTDIASAEAFGGEAVVILDSENLRIRNSIGTRGKPHVHVLL